MLLLLEARGDLVIFGEGKAAFVSHQWLAKEHPDPFGRQMRVLQRALKRLMRGQGFVPLDFVTEVVTKAKALPMKLFQTKLFLWYDYFSVPQDGQNQQAEAIQSIPAYVAKCHFFMALCPFVESREAKVLSALSWGRRGWCRLERAARELSAEASWILLQDEASMELVGTAFSFGSGCLGEGDFTVEEDRVALAPVMRSILLQKLQHCLRSKDFCGFRRHLNLQGVHLRGLQVEPLEGLLPSLQLDEVAEFLHQNGFRRVCEVDGAGWQALHYAALAGNANVLQGLLKERANVNQRTLKDVPSLGYPPRASALDLTLFYKHHEATRLLLEARASLEGGTAPAIQWAAQGDNAEGIRMLCALRANPLAKDYTGDTPLQSAAGLSATRALEELVTQSRPSERDLSLALFDATSFRGGSVQLVHRLLDLRADINFQHSTKELSRTGRMLLESMVFRHRLGATSMGSTFAYHMKGSTPLMQAIRSGQYEAAAALLAAGASVKLHNSRKWTAKDFAKGKSIPDFLHLGLDGDTSECQRVCSLAEQLIEERI